MRGASSVSFKSECISGGKKISVEPLKRSIAAYCRSDSNVKKMYIGIASGGDAVNAMQRRYAGAMMSTRKVKVLMK
jgi:hypothetical protein